MLKGGLCLWDEREDDFLASCRLSQLLDVLMKQPHHRQEIPEFVEVFLISLAILSFGICTSGVFPLIHKGKLLSTVFIPCPPDCTNYTLSCTAACSKHTPGIIISSADSLTEPVAPSLPFTNTTGEREFF